MIDLPPSTPIEEVFPDAQWTGVRTLGDLHVAIARGEVSDLAVLRALGIKGKNNVRAIPQIETPARDSASESA